MEDFPLFSSLPAEIRLKVWGYCLQSSRTITITCPNPTFQTFKPGVVRAPLVFKSDQRPPALLHVNHETRTEALAVYKPYFKTSRAKENTYKEKTYTSGQSYIYVSFALDTVRFADSVLSHLAETELQGIQNLILVPKDCAYFAHFNMEFIQQMKGLKHLDIWADRIESNSWLGGDAYIRQLLSGFHETKENGEPISRYGNSKASYIVR